MEIYRTLRSNCLNSPGDDEEEEEDYNDSFGLLGTHGVVGIPFYLSSSLWKMVSPLPCIVILSVVDQD